MRSLIALILLVIPVMAAAQDVGGFFRGGVAVTAFEEEDSFGNRIELDGGAGINLTGGVRFVPGIMLRAAWTHSEHEGGEYFFPGVGSGTFEQDAEIDEFRLGVFYQPPHERVVSFRAGAGYEGVRIDVPALYFDLDFDGVFVEGAVLFRVAEVVTFDVGLALMGLEDNYDQDAGGAEFRASALFGAGPLDFEASYRALNINTEYWDGGDVDDTFAELRFTVGASWGYPQRSRVRRRPYPN